MMGLSTFRIVLLTVVWKNVLATRNSEICANKEFNDDTFTGLESLLTLHCVNSSLTIIKPDAFSKTPKLKSIVIEGNSMENIPTGSFNGLNKLEKVKISSNKIPLTFGNKTFAHLPSLKQLQLIKSNIQWLPEDVFIYSRNLRNIKISHNDIEIIPENIFFGLGSLITLDLSHNKIHNLSRETFETLTQLTHLNLEWNDLEVLPNELFAALHNLKYLNLDHCRLFVIDNNLFKNGSSKLEVLSIASNLFHLKSQEDYIHELQRAYKRYEVGKHRYVFRNKARRKQKLRIEDNSLSDSKYSPFMNLYRLKKLILRNNSLSNIYPDWKYHLKNLELLDLSMNNYMYLTTDEMDFSSNGITIDLRHNKISVVNLNYAVTAIFNNKTNNYNAKILLDNNPLHCDCYLYRVLIKDGRIATSSSGIQLDLENLKCATPWELRGQLLRELPSSVGTCDLPPEVCPHYCFMCKHHPSNNMVEYNCDSFPNSTFITKNIRNQVLMKLNKQPTAINNLNIEELDLSGLNIEKVLFKPTPSLNLLNLTNSAIIKPPVEFLKQNNVSLYLANTRIECICPYLDDLKLMKSSTMILDYDNVTCKIGTENVNFKDVDLSTLCNQSNIVTPIIASTVVCIVVIIVSVVVFKNYNKIQIYLMHKSIFARFYEDDEEIGKVYDCFISYSHKDREFVEEKLIPKLENDFNQRTCVHSRDWDIGEYIMTQIQKSVENSRKTVIVLSEDFLKSMWATVEFNLAHSVALRECRAKVILLLLGDVAEHPQLSEELKSYIKTNTYLSCSDKKFWERLEKALPARKKRFVWSRNKEKENVNIDKCIAT